MLKTNGIQGKYLEYKGKPLVREGDEIYYGLMSNKFYLFLMIMTKKKASRVDMEIPDKILVQILPTDGSGKVEKQTTVSGLYEAFDLGCAWLDRANRA